MTEPGEPIPRDSDSYDLGLKKAILAEALGAFSDRILANDMLFRVVKTTLEDAKDAHGAAYRPQADFRVTPNMKDGKYSLCLEESEKGYAGGIEAGDGATGDVSLGFTTMKYAPVCSIEADNNGNRGIVVDKPFIELAVGRDVATEKPTSEETADLETAVKTVLGGINEIADYCAQRGVEIVSDKFGRPQLLEEAQNTFYLPE